MRPRPDIHRWLRSSANAVRAVLLATALLAAGTAAVWTLRPAWISALDGWLTQRYVDRYRVPVEDAIALHDTEPERAIRRLEEALGAMADIHKGNRLAPIKRRALVALTGALAAAGDLPRALQRVEDWLAFDDRDLEAHVRRAEWAFALPERRADGLFLAGKLFDRFPGSTVTCEPYVRMLLAAGRDEEAAAALFRLLREGGRPGEPASRGGEPTWTLLWDPGEGFAFDRKARVAAAVEDGRLAVTFELPPRVRRIRIGLPAHARFDLVDPQVEIRAGPQVVPVSLFDLRVLLHEIERQDATLRTFGEPDPYVDFAMDSPLPVPFSVTLRGAVREPGWDWVEQVLALSAAAELGRSCLQAADRDPDLAASYLELRRAVLLRRGVRLGWRSPSRGSDVDLALKTGSRPEEAVFDGVIEAVQGARGLRLELPPVAGLVCELLEIEVLQGEESRSLPIGELSLAPSAGVERQEGLLVVRGAEAACVLELPAGVVLGAGAVVRLRGILR